MGYGPDDMEVQLELASSNFSLSLNRSSLIARGRTEAARMSSLVFDRLSVLRRKAEEGHSDAQYELGVALREGYLKPESTGDRLIIYMRKLQESIPREGDTDAERELKLKQNEALLKDHAKLAEDKRRRNSIEKNLTEAVEWLRKAADQRHLYALNDLGDMYLQGDGVERDQSEALRCYSSAADDDWDHGDWDPDSFGDMWQKAADLGHGKSQYFHGNMKRFWWERFKEEAYLVDAYKWVSLAITSGQLDLSNQLDANRVFGELSAMMSADQVKQAENKAQEWTGRGKKITE
jgi:TPR repeat protein